MPDPMRTIRVGDVLAKSGRLPEARNVYRRAAEAFEDDGRLMHARAAWRLVLSLHPRDAHARERIAELGLLPARAERSRETPPPAEGDEPTVVDRSQRYRTELREMPRQHTFARITLAPNPRTEIETDRCPEDPIPADEFCDAPGHATVSIPIAVLRRKAFESDENGDEEMWIDIPEE